MKPDQKAIADLADRIEAAIKSENNVGIHPRKVFAGTPEDWQVVLASLRGEAAQAWRQVDNPRGYTFIGFPNDRIKGVYLGGEGVAYVYDLPKLDCSTSAQEGK